MSSATTPITREPSSIKIGESVDSFVTDLHVLAEHCGYGPLHDEMIRDRLVVGLQDARHPEKLQLDADLALAKALTQARQYEAVKNSKESFGERVSRMRTQFKQEDKPIGEI